MKSTKLPLILLAIFLSGCANKPVGPDTPDTPDTPDIPDVPDTPVKHNKIKIEISDIKKAAYLYSIGVDFDKIKTNDLKINNAIKEVANLNSYYQNISSWNNAEDLKNKLDTLLNRSDVIALNYNANWEPCQKGDESENNLDNVYLLYSDEEDLKTNTKKGGIGWDREHIFCASLLTGKNTSEATQTPGIATDFHNLFASYTTGNNARGNKNLGNVSLDAGYEVKEEQGYRYYVKDDENDPSIPSTFEPLSQEDKGLASRALFYMATRYGNSHNIFLREETCNTGEKCHGNLSDILSWNNYEVTRHEYKHNEEVYKLQNNRNPFVDYPELVDYIYGEKKNQAGTLSSLTPSAISLAIKDHENEFYKYSIGEVKYKYELGESYHKNDLSVYKINKDMSKSKYSGAFDTNITEGTIFNELGEQEVKVFVDNLEIAKYKISVTNTDKVRDATYNHYFNFKDDFKENGNTENDAGKEIEYTFSGVKWNLYRKQGKINGQGSGDIGTQFGTATVPCELIYLESTDIFNVYEDLELKGIYFEGNCASGETITIKFYLDDELIKTQSITREKSTGNIHYFTGVDL